MASVVRSVRVPEELQQELDREFTNRGVREWSTGVIDLLSEAVRMRRIPGIVFVDSLSGRRAALAGTGLEVWECIAMWRAVGEDETAFAEAYHWLTPAQRQAAFAYYRFYPSEIDARIALDERWTPEILRAELPGLTTLGE